MKNRIPIFGNGKETASSLRDVLSIGPYELIIELDSKVVFPPSETTLALSDLLLTYDVDSVFDVGTGSGLLAMVAAKRGAKKVVGLDVNPSAVVTARKNCELNSIKNVEFIRGDILNHLSIDKFDLIVTNPPFMPMPERARFVSEEIMKAVYGGTNGIDSELSFAEHIRDYLKKDGVLLFPVPEHGDFKQVIELLRKLYAVELKYRKPIRYWLSEYDSSYTSHVSNLCKKGINSLYSVDGFVYTNLNIFEAKVR